MKKYLTEVWFWIKVSTILGVVIGGIMFLMQSLLGIVVLFILAILSLGFVSTI